MQITEKLKELLKQHQIEFGCELENTDYVICSLFETDNKKWAQYNLYDKEGFLKDVIFNKIYLNLKPGKPNLNKLQTQLEPLKRGRMKVGSDEIEEVPEV